MYADVFMLLCPNLWSVLIADSVLDDPIFGRRKHGFKPKHPEEIENVPDEGVLYPSDLPSSPSKEKVKLQNGEHKSYSPPISEVKDPSFNKGQVQSSLLVPPSGIITMVRSLSFSSPPPQYPLHHHTPPPPAGQKGANAQICCKLCLFFGINLTPLSCSLSLTA